MIYDTPPPASSLPAWVIIIATTIFVILLYKELRR